MKWKQAMGVEILSHPTRVYTYMSTHVLPVFCQVFEREQSPIVVTQPPGSKMCAFVVVFEKCRQRRVCMCYTSCYEKL